MSVIDDLLAAADQQQILDAEVLPEFVRQGINTTDWAVGDVTRADAYLAAKLREFSKGELKVLASTRFGDYLWGYQPLPNATPEQQADLLAWAPIIAKQCFGITPIDATYTRRKIRLTNSIGSAYNRVAGRIIIVFPSGNRYVSDGDYVSAGHDSVDVVFHSQFTVDSTHAYADAAATSGIAFLTADLPGVTATNPPAAYSVVTQVGPGLGTITPDGTPDGSHRVAIRINVGGHSNVSEGDWSYSLDGGAWNAIGFLDDYGDLAGLGVDLTFADNGGYFIADTIYYFSWPGTDVTEVGRSAETPQEIGARVRAQQPLLSILRDANGSPVPIAPTAAAYKALILQAFPEVKTCVVKASSTINNVVNIYVAGQGALLSSTTVAQISAWLKALGMIADRPVVSAPATSAITLAAGTFKVKAAQAVSAKAEAQRRVALYLAGVDPVAPLEYGGLIDRSYLISLIRTTPGVTYGDDALTINGSATDLQLAAATMATYSGDVGTSQTWVTE